MKKTIWIGSALFCLVFWLSLLSMMTGWVTGCAKIGDAGVYVIQANDLADDALALERIVTAADVPEDQKPGLQQAVQDLRLIAAEARRFETISDLSNLDLTRMHRAYLRVKSDMLYIRSLIYDEQQTWQSIPEHDQLQLVLFWKDATALAEDIDSFIADPDTSNYLQVAARITAYGTIAARILLAVAPKLIEN